MNHKPSALSHQPADTKRPSYSKLVIRRRELAETLGISRSTTYLREKPSSPYFDPLFPKSVKLGENRAVGFVFADVLAYLDALAEKRATA